MEKPSEHLIPFKLSEEFADIHFITEMDLKDFEKRCRLSYSEDEKFFTDRIGKIFSELNRMKDLFGINSHLNRYVHEYLSKIKELYSNIDQHLHMGFEYYRGIGGTYTIEPHTEEYYDFRARNVTFFKNLYHLLEEFKKTINPYSSQNRGKTDVRIGYTPEQLEDLKKDIERLKSIQQTKEETTEENAALVSGESEPVPFSDKTAHKILLLHELGIIDHLRKRYFSATHNRTDTDLSKLIATIIEEPKPETVRKGISGILSKGKDSIIKPTGIRQVKSYLASFGIDLQALKDPD